MLPKLSPFPTVSVVDWAQWLSSIAEKPQSHNVLYEVKSKVQFLTAEQRDVTKKAGSSAQRLTIKKMIAITQKVWDETSLNPELKAKMLKGMVYINEERQNRYDHLSLFKKCIAWLKGIGKELASEKASILELRNKLALGKAEEESRRLTNSDEYDLIESKLNSLFNSKNETPAGFLKNKWFEDAFMWEKRLVGLSQGKISPELQLKINALKDKLKLHNESMPRVETLIEHFGNNCLKRGLKETLIALCQGKNLSVEEDKKIFGCSELEIYARYVKWLIKEKCTEFSFSLCGGIERMMKEKVKTGTEEPFQEIIEDRRVIFLPSKKTAWIKENFIGKGSYKLACTITEYFSCKVYEDRNKYVILQPLSAVEDELKDAKEEEDDSAPESIEGGIAGKERRSSEPNEPIIRRRSSTIGNNPTVKMTKRNAVINLEREEESCSSVVINSGSVVISDSVVISNSVVNSSTFVTSDREGSEVNKWKNINMSGPVALLKDDTETTEEEDFQKEAENCLRYSHFPGVCETIDVFKLGTSWAFIQHAAGYFTATTTAEKKLAVTFVDMFEFYKSGLMTQKDQIILLNMIGHFLIGVESFHKQGIIHRDLKPQNILCFSDGIAKVSDLGTICEKENKIKDKDGKEVENKLKKQRIGSPHYMSPDIAKYAAKGSQKWIQIDVASDLWASGLILWLFFSAKGLEQHPAFNFKRGMPDLDDQMIPTYIGQLLNKHTGLKYATEYPQPSENSMAYYVWKCTRPDAKERPSITNLIKFYQSWSSNVKRWLIEGKIKDIADCFEEMIN